MSQEQSDSLKTETVVRYVIQNPTANKIRYKDKCEQGYPLRDSPYPYYYIHQDVWNLWGQPMELELRIVPLNLAAPEWATPEEILARQNTSTNS